MLQQQQETNTGSEGKAPGRKGRHLHGELQALQEGQPAVPRLTAPCTFPRSPTSQNTRGSQETLERKPVSTKSETQLERDSSESPVQPLPQTVVPLTMAGDVKWDSAPQTTHSPRSSGTRPGQDSHSPWTVPGTPSPVGFACRPVWTACPLVNTSFVCCSDGRSSIQRMKHFISDLLSRSAHHRNRNPCLEGKQDRAKGPDKQVVF